MNIHEYQAKELLKGYGVSVPEGRMASSVEEAMDVARTLKVPLTVVKAQIHAGGRGAGTLQGDPEGKGGVRLAHTLEDVRAHASALLGHTLVTKQTGPEGQQVRKVYIEKGCAIDQELYLSLLVDRARDSLVIMASSEGGMDIEEVAAHAPHKITRLHVHPATGFSPFYARRLGYGLGLQGKALTSFGRLLSSLYRAFIELDASIIEINPLVVTGDEVMALDAKVVFDDNGLFRHQNLADLLDEHEIEPHELEATRHGLNYIKLDGSIGCMVNGAGLAMATMDIIKLKGASPANFLDVGGGATAERVTTAFKLILSDPHVQGILVNIFGGIMRCDIIAEGIISAAREVELKVPLVVRLAGTNVDKGKALMKASGLPLVSAENLNDAADKIVEMVNS